MTCENSYTVSTLRTPLLKHTVLTFCTTETSEIESERLRVTHCFHLNTVQSSPLAYLLQYVAVIVLGVLIETIFVEIYVGVKVSTYRLGTLIFLDIFHDCQHCILKIFGSSCTRSMMKCTNGERKRICLYSVFAPHH